MNASESSSRMVAWAVWAIASVFYAYQYVLRVMPNIMLTDIMNQFSINSATFGQFSGIYYIGYAFMHLPIGILLDRFGPRKVMTASILCSVAGLLPLIFASHWVYPIAGRFLTGVGSSAAILGVFKIIRLTFEEKYFTRMLSFSVTIGLLGAIYGGGPVGYLRETLGYQEVLQTFILGGIFLAALTYWIVPEQTSSNQKTVLSDIKEVLLNGRVIVSCLLAGLMVGPLEGFADVWGTIFLKNVYGYNNSLASSVPSMIFFGMCFGAPVLSYIANKVGSYVLTIIGAAFIMAVCFSGMLFSEISPSILSVSFLLVGMCCAYQILAIYKISTYVRSEVAGLTTAIANMIIMTFGYAFHSVIGWVIESAGGATSSEALVLGTAVIPIAMFIALCGYTAVLIFDQKQLQTC